MPQGEGYWYNPKSNVALVVTRHEVDIKKPNVQQKINLHSAAREALKELPNTPENEDQIKILGVRSGLVRIRDWQKFVSIQFFGKGSKAKDTLFGLGQLIESFKNGSHKKLPTETRKLASLLGTSWQLKIDNLGTGDSDTTSPDEFLKKYAKEGYMEEKKYKKSERSVRDIPMDGNLVEEAEKRLRKHGFFKEEEMDSLFEDVAVIKENDKFGMYKESQRSMSRAWQHLIDPAVFGIITAYRGDYDKSPDKDGRRNKARQVVLINKIKNAGFGVFKLFGAWDEGGGGVGREESLLFYPRKDMWENMVTAGQELFKLTKKWSDEFEQDGAIYRNVPDPEAPIMLWRNKEENWETGEVTDINDSIKAGKGYKLGDDISDNEGKLYINKVKKDLGSAWSELTKGPKSRNFVFEDLEEIDDGTDE